MFKSTVKEEPEWGGMCGESDVAALADLYAGHLVKDELVIGPEILQLPSVPPEKLLEIPSDVYTEGSAQELIQSEMDLDLELLDRKEILETDEVDKFLIEVTASEEKLKISSDVYHKRNAHEVIKSKKTCIDLDFGFMAEPNEIFEGGILGDEGCVDDEINCELVQKLDADFVALQKHLEISGDVYPEERPHDFMKFEESYMESDLKSIEKCEEICEDGISQGECCSIKQLNILTDTNYKESARGLRKSEESCVDRDFDFREEPDETFEGGRSASEVNVDDAAKDVESSNKSHENRASNPIDKILEDLSRTCFVELEPLHFDLISACTRSPSTYTHSKITHGYIESNVACNQLDPGFMEGIFEDVATETRGSDDEVKDGLLEIPEEPHVKKALVSSADDPILAALSRPCSVRLERVRVDRLRGSDSDTHKMQPKVMAVRRGQHFRFNLDRAKQMIQNKLSKDKRLTHATKDTPEVQRRQNKTITKVHNTPETYEVGVEPVVTSEKPSYHSMSVRKSHIVHNYVCDQCGKILEKRTDFKKHLQTHSRKNDIKPIKNQCKHSSDRKSESRLKNAKLIKCNLCDFICVLEKELLDHQKKHPIGKSFKCKQCEYNTNKKSSMTRHEALHTGQKPYKCRLCNYATSRQEMLICHEKIHSGELFQCGQCHYKSHLKGHLIVHLTKHSKEKPFECTLCDFKTGYKNSLKNHLVTHTNEKPYNCNFCEFRCTQKSNLRSHQKIHFGTKPYACNKCDYRSNKKWDLATHERVHTGDKPFKCCYCSFKCSAKKHLKTHEMIHTGQKPFKCTYCNYACIQGGDMRTHERTHTGEKPFKCNLCDYRTAQKSHFNTHMKRHTGDKRFKCSFCGYRCIEKGTLRNHEMIHTGEKRYQCSRCDYKSISKSSLDSHHQRKHTKERPNKCNRCGQTFRYQPCLKRHLNTCHDE